MTPELRAARRLRSATRRLTDALSTHIPARNFPPTEWVRTEAADTVRTLPSFRLFAVLGTWYEADIVGATVRNALEQGCERVYLLDNDSPDDSVAVAEAAGATLARSFTTDSFDDELRSRLFDEVVTEVTEEAHRAGDPHVWWLYLDADEFHHGPAGTTVRSHLEGLDRRHRVVGARVFNHYPDRDPAYRTGAHPLDCQPRCEEVLFPMCDHLHHKHPLLRRDADRPPIRCLPGFHQARSDEQPLLEPPAPVFLHHFPYRDEAVTRRRLEALWAGPPGAERAADPRWTDHMRARRHSVDAVYAQRWSQVRNHLAGQAKKGVHPRPWLDLVPPADAAVPTWDPR